MCWRSFLHPTHLLSSDKDKTTSKLSIPTTAVMKEKDICIPKKSHYFVSTADHKKSLIFWYHGWELLNWISTSPSGRTGHMCFAHISSNLFLLFPHIPGYNMLVFFSKSTERANSFRVTILLIFLGQYSMMASRLYFYNITRDFVSPILKFAFFFLAFHT